MSGVVWATFASLALSLLSRTASATAYAPSVRFLARNERLALERSDLAIEFVGKWWGGLVSLDLARRLQKVGQVCGMVVDR
jgi:hypothetical protein